MTNKVKLLVILACCGSAFGLLTAITPIACDDFWLRVLYYKNYPLAPGAEPSLYEYSLAWPTIAEVIRYVKTSYLTWMGRFDFFVLSIVVPGLPHWLFSVLNGIVWSLLLYGIGKLMKLSFRQFIVMAFASFALLLNYDATLWLVGSIAYLWPVTWTVWAVVAFTMPWMKKSALSLRGAWLWVGLPIAFVVAGGHELISAAIGLILVVHWTMRISGERRLPVDGQFVASLGYALGSFALVFAPGSLQRAQSAGMLDRALSAQLLGRGLAAIDVFVANPVVLVCLFAVVFMFAYRKFRSKLSRLDCFVFLVFLFSFLVTVGVFGAGGGDRAVWMLWFCTFLVVMAVGRICLVNVKAPVRNMVLVVVCFAGVAVYVSTLVNGVVKKRELMSAVEEWMAGKTKVFVRDKSHQSVARCWLDRSISRDFYVAIGCNVKALNSSLALYYHRPNCFALGLEEYKSIFVDGSIFDAANELENLPGWYSRPDLDVIASFPSDAQCRAWHDMDILTMKPEYEKSAAAIGGFFNKVWRRVTHRGRPDFPGCAADVEIANDSATSGFYTELNGRKVMVFLHNRHIPRSLIRNIKVSRNDIQDMAGQILSGHSAMELMGTHKK